MLKRVVLLLVVTWLTGASEVHAQRCGATCADPQSLLGSSEQVLVTSIPEIKRSHRPVPGPNNSLGKWLLPDMRFAGQAYAATYFMQSGRLVRIELFSTAPALLCRQQIPLKSALEELGRKYGDTLASDRFQEGEKTTQSAAFGTPDMDVAVYFSLNPGDCSTRIVYKMRQIKNSSEL